MVVKDIRISQKIKKIVEYRKRYFEKRKHK